MACELIGAKLIAPYFGGSLYVWASVLAVTLSGLAAGYFLGGMLSKKYNNRSLLFYALLLAGLSFFGMTTIGNYVLGITIYMSVQWGSLVSLLTFLFPPLLFFGMASPVIINLINDDADSSGKSAGIIYSVSTVGGIFFTLLCGFYILPQYGIVKPSMVFGGIILCVALVYFILEKKYSALFIFLPVFFLFPKNYFPQDKNLSLLYESEGIPGEIKVVDYTYFSPQKEWKKARALLVNNIGQTIVDAENPEHSLLDYTNYASCIASNFPKGSRVLLCGLGGGVIYNRFRKSGFNVDAVELDPRMEEVSKKYFSVDSAANITIDDARHFLRTCNKKYDIIFFDTFHGETPPGYVITLESLKEMKKNLSEDGIIMVNFYGFYSGALGKSSAWLYKTFRKAGYKIKMLRTNLQDEKFSNLIFVAGDNEIDFSKISFAGTEMQGNNSNDCFLPPEKLNLGDAGVFTDEKPMLEYLDIAPSVEWRKAYTEYFTKNFLREKIFSR